MEWNTSHLPEYLQQTLARLIGLREETRDIAIDLLMEGELKIYTFAPLGEGYPINYADEIKGSLDPDVQSLAVLLDRIDETIEAFKMKHAIE